MNCWTPKHNLWHAYRDTTQRLDGVLVRFAQPDSNAQAVSNHPVVTGNTHLRDKLYA
jgi:hypothetical protein